MKRSIKIKKIYNWLIKGKSFLQICFPKSYEKIGIIIWENLNSDQVKHSDVFSFVICLVGLIFKFSVTEMNSWEFFRC